MMVKRDVLKGLVDRVQLTEDEEELLIDNYIDQSQLYNEDYDKRMLSALRNLDQINKLSQIFSVTEDEALSSVLGESMKVRAASYQKQCMEKFERFLTIKMKDFQSPLDCSSNFLQFIKYTMTLLKDRTDYYNNVIKELVLSRT